MKNPQELIGKKVRGFKFEKYWNKQMKNCIGKVGIIKHYFKHNNMMFVSFDNECWSYPYDQIEAHLVEDEIQTFTKEDLKTFYNIGFVNGVNKESKSSCLEFEEHFKDIFKPTKEEQLTAILGSSDKVSEIIELFNDKKTNTYDYDKDGRFIS